MNDLQKLQKVFKLIRLLNTPPARTAKRLMNLLDIQKSQFYRYKKLLEDIGYKIQTDDQHKMSIETGVSQYGKDFASPEELEHLENALRQVSGNHPLTTTLLRKFNTNLSLIPLADALPHLHATRNISLIRMALNRKNKLIIRRYQSFTSETTLDRIIEPLELTEDYKYLIGWEPAKNRQGQFKISRMMDVDILDEPITTNHEPSPMDIFGLTGDQWHDVKMKLSPLAYSLLAEEFPLSMGFVRRDKSSKQFIFDGRVRNWKGIGRFVLGLPGEIEVVSPDGFLRYLSERVEKF